MYRVLVPVAALAIAGMAYSLAPVQSPQGVAHRLDAVDATIEQGDLVSAVETLQHLSAEPGYSHFDAATRMRVDDRLARVAFTLKRWDVAHAASVRLTESPAAPAEAWWLRIETAKMAGDFEDAALVVRRLGPSIADYLETADDEGVSELDEGLGLTKHPIVDRLEFEDLLDRTKWRPKNDYFAKDMIWHHFAIGLLERGDRTRAKEAAARLTAPFIQPLVLADRRFDGLHDDRDPSSAYRSAFEGELSVRTTEAEHAYPRSSYAKAALASTYYELSRYEDAVAEATKALAPPPPRNESDAYDIEIARPFAVTVKAMALARLGRTDEALSVVDQFDPEGQVSTGQAFLRAQVLQLAGRGGQSLVVLGALGGGESLRPYAQQHLAAMRLCAAQELGNAPGIRVQRDLIDQHPFHSASATLIAYACQDDHEAGVAYVVRLLADPARRHLVLQELQVFALPRGASAYERRAAAFMAGLRQDPRVQAALEPVGRINQFDLPQQAYLY